MDSLIYASTANIYGTATVILANNSASVWIYAGGAVYSGRFLNSVEFISSGSNDYRSIINGGSQGVEGTATGSIIENNGRQTTAAGGVADSSDGEMGATLVGNAGGTFIAPLMETGASAILYSGSTINGGTLNDGTITANSGSTVNGTITFGTLGGTLTDANTNISLTITGFEKATSGASIINLSGVTLSAAKQVAIGSNDILTIGGDTITFTSDATMVVTETPTSTGVQITELTAPPECFVAGTRIAVIKEGATFQIPVEELQEGDEVVTATGTQKITYLGNQAFDGRFIAGNRRTLPICIKSGALGENIPAADLHVSPGHAFAFGDVLIQVRHLVNGINIRQAENVESVHYYHIGLARHDLVYAEGALAESLFPSDIGSEFGMAARAMENCSTADLPSVMCLPLVHCGHKVEEARHAIMHRAPELLLGYVDEVSIEERRLDGASVRIATIGGWAQNQADDQATNPPVLHIFANGVEIGSTMANMYRHDLCKLYEYGSRHAFPTGGRHAFRCDVAVACDTRAQDISVRGVNGQALPLAESALRMVSPLCWNATTHHNLA